VQVDPRVFTSLILRLCDLAALRFKITSQPRWIQTIEERLPGPKACGSSSVSDERNTSGPSQYD
jgi:hypothetical protein